MKHNSKRAGALAMGLALIFCLSLTACGGSKTDADTVPVQSVSMLMGMDLSGSNRFSGVAEGKSTQKIEKDNDKTVEECLVEVGQEVKKGDVLFRYDAESIQLSLESAQLEVDQLQNSIESYNTQISELEKERKSAGKSEKLSYTLQIQEAQLNQAEAQYNLKQKQAALEKVKKSAENVEVKAPVNGVVQSIASDDGSGSYDSSGDSSGDGSSSGTVYITLLETGTYRVKGTANENNIYNLSEGMDVTVVSRTDSSKHWAGTVSEVNVGSTASSDSTTETYSDDENSGESATQYNFYVTLENSDDMMMGQHLYILPGTVTAAAGTVALPSTFIVQEGDSAYVWASSHNDKLEKRTVTLGDYQEDSDSYIITDGLTADDYVADPTGSLTEGSSVVKYDSESYGSAGVDSADSSAMADGSMDMEYFGDMSTFTEDGEADGTDGEAAENAVIGGADTPSVMEG